MNPLDQAVQLIQKSSSLVALTGAGISTDSGIPDFRSPRGIWSKYPVTYGEYNYFKEHPEQIYELGRELLPLLMSAQPNEGHKALKELEDMGTLKAVITQNVDGLHQKAGSRRVVEIHGTFKTATCLTCGKKRTIEELVPLLDVVPRCPECSGIIKPDVVFFGELLPEKAFSEAVDLAQKADVMIAAGTSLEVYPASHLVLIAKKKGRVIIMNDEKTALDRVADVVVKDKLSACLPSVVKRLKEVIS